jgi:hypothetical protein
MMKVADRVQLFASLSTNDKIRFLSRLGWELTIAGRDAYKPQTEELTHPTRLRAINEIQHCIFSHLYALASDNSVRYPDDVIVTIILEESRDRAVNDQVQDAFDRAAEFLENNSA